LAVSNDDYEKPPSNVKSEETPYPLSESLQKLAEINTEIRRFQSLTLNQMQAGEAYVGDEPFVVVDPSSHDCEVRVVVSEPLQEAGAEDKDTLERDIREAADINASAEQVNGIVEAGLEEDIGLSEEADYHLNGELDDSWDSTETPKSCLSPEKLDDIKNIPEERDNQLQLNSELSTLSDNGKPAYASEEFSPESKQITAESDLETGTLKQECAEKECDISTSLLTSGVTASDVEMSHSFSAHSCFKVPVSRSDSAVICLDYGENSSEA
jgi:hypothetical protein